VRVFLQTLPGSDTVGVTDVVGVDLHLCAPADAHPDAWAVCGTLDEVDAAARRGGNLWLRGSEAGGAICDLSGLILARAAATTGRPWVVEGVGPRASAALLRLGATAAVATVETWLNVGTPIVPGQRARLTRAAHARDTEVAWVGTRGHRRLVRGRRDEVDAADWWTRDDASIPAPQSVAQVHLGEGRCLAETADAVRRAIAPHLAAEVAHLPLLDTLGTGLPVVQGPMANVTERPGLSIAVRAAGGLPFAALGALDAARSQAVLEAFGAVPSPWGAGIIGFDVLPQRAAQREALRARRHAGNGPEVVLVAGGTVALARELTDEGFAVWLHTPSGRLSADALRAGVAAVVLEGQEAGGHVGAITSLGLWEEGLAAAELSPGLVVLAGGIGDAFSAAVAFAMGGVAAAGGCRLAVQAGTAFFFTDEVAEHGQITPLYQSVALATRETVQVGATVGLPLRCAPNAYTASAIATERRWLDDGVDRDTRRARMEHGNLGRTRMAAQGIERRPGARADEPPAARYRPVSPIRAAEEAAFTLGQGAPIHRVIAPTAALVTALSRGAAALLGARVQPAADAPRAVRGGPSRLSAPRQRAGEPIAIVGVGCVLPGAGDVGAFWDQLLRGLDAIDAIPVDRWARDRYWHPGASPASEMPALTYTQLAGAVGVDRFDPLRYRIPPRIVPTLDRSQRLALAVADEAIARAGWFERVDRRRAAVVFGNAMGGEHAKSLAVRVRFREILAVLADDPATAGWSVTDLAALEQRVEARLRDRLPPVEVESMAGLLSNVVAGRVAAWLDWMGGNLTVDAACAASLAAVTVAVDWLRLGRCDAVLAGGVDTDLAPETYVGFCRTDALSAQGSTPFSTRADGFVMGEGAAAFALKRLADARRDGDPVWAVVRGVGQSSDGRGRGITAPRAEGQELAVSRAHADAGLGRGQVGVLEAHGTGTPLGDATEAGVLAAWNANAPHPVFLGSVKASIGHLKGAAGAAGLLKATLMVATGVTPPTLGAGPVIDAVGGLHLPRTVTRLALHRAGVSAFGFGGTNYHLLLDAPPGDLRAPVEREGWTAAATSMLPPAPERWANAAPPQLACYAAADAAQLATALRDDAPCSPTDAAMAPMRVAVAWTGDRAAALNAVCDWFESGTPALALPQVLAWRGAGPPSPVVGLAPGQGAQRVGAWDRLCRFPAAAAALASWHDRRDLERGDDGEARRDTVTLHRTLPLLTAGWAAVLRDAGVPLAATLGHSLGEIGALIAAGRVALGPALQLAELRGQALADCPGGSMIAVDLPADEALQRAPSLWLAADNGPRASVLAGPTPAVDAVAEALRATGATVQRLAVEHAFHSPAVAPAAEAVRVARCPTRPSPTAAWSASSAAPFGDAFPSLLADALTSPVRFAPAARAVASSLDAPPVWLELGPGSTLVRHAVAAAGGVGAPLDPGDAMGIARAAALLAAHGHPGLAMRTPRAWLERAPAIPQRVSRPVPTPLSSAMETTSVLHSQAAGVPAGSWQRQAAAVDDLRISALADPGLAHAYQDARRALLHALAAHDAATVGVRPMPSAPADVSWATPPRTAAAALSTPPASSPPPAAERPAPAVPPPQADAISQHATADADTVRQTVVDAISEVTGYPPDALTDGADLEADLGIDSIRKMEILGLLQRRLVFSAKESDYADLARIDLAGLVAYARARQGVEAAPTGPSAPVLAVAAWTPLERAAPDPGPLPLTAWRQPAGASPAAATAACLGRAQSETPGPILLIAADDPGGWAAVGFTRALSREWGVSLRQIVVAAGTPEADIRAEAAAVERPETVRLSLGDAQGLHLLPLLPEAASEQTYRTILVTGGPNGIAAHCAAALAPTRLAFFARRPADDEALAPWRAAGREVRSWSVDLTDADAVERAVAELIAAWGPPDLVLHGAGALADARVADLRMDQIAAVVGPKVDGLQALHGALRDAPPCRWVVLGSVVEHLGNPGQTLYTAANAAATHLAPPPGAHAVAVRFGPWSDIGMAARTGRLEALAARGVPALSPAAGSAAFAAALRAGAAEVVAGISARAVPPLPWPLTALTGWEPKAVSAQVALDPAAPALADHQVAGRPLVPAALWVAAIRALGELRDARPLAMHALRIHAPTFVDQARADLRVRLVATAAGWRATVQAGDTCVAEAELVPAAGGPSDDPPADAACAHDWYRPGALFHGPTWQLLDRVSSGSDDAVVARLRDGPLPPDARAFDSAMQLAVAWSAARTGQLALPVGAARWELAKHAAPHLLRARVGWSDGVLCADVRGFSTDGRVVLWADGLRLHPAGHADPSFRWPDV
jgi:acyl transferase domain-containing protein/NAD(P)H-dependent flavin oxidoreductase YrpB (nitropropane dioxygenase family)